MAQNKQIPKPENVEREDRSNSEDARKACQLLREAALYAMPYGAEPEFVIALNFFTRKNIVTGQVEVGVSTVRSNEVTLTEDAISAILPEVRNSVVHHLGGQIMTMGPKTNASIEEERQRVQDETHSFIPKIVDPSLTSN